MTVGCNAHGTQTKLYVEPGSSPHTFDSSSERWPIISSTVRKQQRILQAQGMLGTRSQFVEHTRNGPYTVAGQIRMEPSPAMLDAWLPRILGAAESSDTFAVAETLPSFGLMIDKDSRVETYTDCKVASAVFSGREGGMIEMVLTIIGKTATFDDTPPSVSLGTTLAHEPYAFTDISFTAQSATVNPKSFALTINNNAGADFFHTITADCINIGERQILLLSDVKLNTTTATALYGQDKDGAAASITLTNGTVSTTVSLARLQAPDNTATIPGKTPFYLPIIGEVRGTGTTEAITVTNDSTV